MIYVSEIYNHIKHAIHLYIILPNLVCILINDNIIILIHYHKLYKNKKCNFTY